MQLDGDASGAMERRMVMAERAEDVAAIAEVAVPAEGVDGGGELWFGDEEVKIAEIPGGGIGIDAGGEISGAFQEDGLDAGVVQKSDHILEFFEDEGVAFAVNGFDGGEEGRDVIRDSGEQAGFGKMSMQRGQQCLFRSGGEELVP